jgi:hypothetical protein
MPGLQQIMRECPGLEIFVAAVDQELNERGYISPGVGDRYVILSSPQSSRHAVETDTLHCLTAVIGFSVPSSSLRCWNMLKHSGSLCCMSKYRSLYGRYAVLRLANVPTQETRRPIQNGASGCNDVYFTLASYDF